EREGSLSGCTFSEAVTWGKYRSVDEEKMVQIWGEYSVIFPILAANVLSKCAKRPLKHIATQLPQYAEKLEQAR
ncbi:MAG: deoxyhypusine synthase family protein, partial [Desulfobacterales bacterium]